MAVDPAKISLKGLYLDLGSTVGGTRHVYNNGVMCAKFYAGFSYGAVSGDGDESTVSDVINWLLANGVIHTCSSNNEPTGTPSENHWTDHNGEDPNGGTYVYDTEVIVPGNNEERDVLPGNSIWHYAYYVGPDAGTTNTINVYLEADYTDSHGTPQTLTTLHDTLLTLVPEEWSFEINDFELYKEIDNGCVSVCYSKNAYGYVEGLYYISHWKGEPDDMHVEPNTATDCDIDDGPCNHHRAFNASGPSTNPLNGGRTLFCVIAAPDKSAYIFLTDKNDPIKWDGGRYSLSFNGRTSILYNEPPDPDKDQYVNAFWLDIVEFDTHNPLSERMKQGVVLQKWQHDSFNISAASQQRDHTAALQVSSSNYTTARAVDCFGQSIDIKIYFNDDYNHYMDDWVLDGVTPVNE